MTVHTHMLFSGSTMQGEVTPNTLNSYPVANLVPLPADYYDPGVEYTWSGRVPAINRAKLESHLIAQVKAESERRRMLIYTPNRGKMKEYQAKKQEVLDFRALTQVTGSTMTVLNAALSVLNTSIALDAPTKQRKFPFAMAEAQLRGETVAQIIARYETGMAGSDGLVATLAAIEQKAVGDLRAAPTVPALRAAYAAIAWPA